MRVVFDTNVIVSGILWAGTPHRALQIAANKQVTSISSEMLVDELRDVLKREKLQKYLARLQTTTEKLVERYLSFTRIIEPATELESTVRDRDDLIVLATAVGGNVDYSRHYRK